MLLQEKQDCNCRWPHVICSCRLSACRFTLFLFVLYFCAIGCRRQAPQQQTVLHGATMGTTYTVKIVDTISSADVSTIAAEIDETLDRVNRSMSTYDPQSELSRWNASTSSDWFSVSADMVAVVAEAIRIGRLSKGSLDVSVDPAVRLWGFGPVSNEPAAGGENDRSARKKIPSDEEIAAVLPLVDFSQLKIRDDPPAVRKTTGAMRVDLSSIAKGYAVDRVADLLLGHGMRNFMVEIGGEVRTAGHNSAGSDWRIAIETPLAGTRRAESVVLLDNRAMATSGDYRNYREQDGVRYSHLIDPRTGRPIRHHLASVSVLSDRCIEADALATALTVLGPEAGYALAQSKGIAAYFIVRSEQGFVQKQTSHWPRATYSPSETAVDTSSDQKTPSWGSSIAISLVASLLVLAATMLALAIRPIFRRRKQQCSCATARQIMNAADSQAAKSKSRKSRGSPLLPIITNPQPESRPPDKHSQS